MSKNQQITYLGEIQRKGIHILSMLIPIIYYFIDTNSALSILIPMTFVALSIDLLMYYSVKFREVAHMFIGGMLRPHELDRESITLNGASWVMIAAVITVGIFPKNLALISFSIVILSDLAAALLGRKYGKRKFMDKSLEGTLAFFVVAICVCFSWTHILGLSMQFFAISIVASLFAAIAEASTIRLKLDDNIVVPLVSGGVMWLLANAFQIPIH